MIKKIVSYFKERKLILILGIIFFLLQLILLDQLFLLRGERDVVFTGYSLAKTGRDLYGNRLPLWFKGLDMGTPFLSFYYSALWWLFIPWRTVFFARLPYAILSLGVIFLIYEIVNKISQNKKLAFLTATIFLFSPGYYHTSRLAIEINLGFTLLLFATYFYLADKKITSFVLFVLTFFSYNGFRPLIPFLLVFLEFYFYLKNKDFKTLIKQSFINILFFAILFGISYFLIDGGMMRSRQTDLVFLDYTDFAPKVDFRRNTAVGPEILKKVFNNKITATVYYMIDVFFKGQDFAYLFTKGDYSVLYATTFTGQFFMVFLPFYYMGWLYLGKKWNKNYFYILAMIPVALIPSIINIDYISFSFRSTLSSVGYGFILACGSLLMIDIFRNAKSWVKTFALLTFLIFLVVELAYFGYNYFFRRPVTMSELFFESERQIGQYLNANKKPYKVYDTSPRSIYTSYVFLNRQVNMNEVQRVLRKGLPYYPDGLQFYQCSMRNNKFNIEKFTIVSEKCADEKTIKLWSAQKNVEKIDYRDFSQKTGYFVFN